MLHQREDRRSVRLIRDRTAAFPVVPTHVKLVHEHAIGDVLRRYDGETRPGPREAPNARAGARRNLEHRNVQVATFDREGYNRDVKHGSPFPGTTNA
jgi:hypothetical protein